MWREWILAMVLTAAFACDLGAVSANTGIDDVDALGVTVNDLNLSIRFYTQVLGFKQVAETEIEGEEIDDLMGVFNTRLRVATLRLGEQLLDLMEFLTPRGRPIPLNVATQDRWYQHIAIVTSDIEKAYQRIRSNDVQMTSTAPRTILGAEMKAFYFEDPDGHPLMLVEFLGEERAKEWKREGDDRLFLGINNTAFVVENTEESLRFYRDTLGFLVDGQDVLEGSEVERLTGVRGVRLQRTQMRAPGGGIPIYLFHFLQPQDRGRDMPADTMPNDLWHWQVQVEVADISSIEEKVKKGGYRIVSESIANFAESFIGIDRAFIARDPDGHAILFYVPKKGQDRG